MGPSARWAAATVSLPSSAVLYHGRHRAGRRAAQRRRPDVCEMATALELVPHASAQPSAATASATISSGRDGSVVSAAASSVQPSAAASAVARRSLRRSQRCHRGRSRWSQTRWRRSAVPTREGLRHWPSCTFPDADGARPSHTTSTAIQNRTTRQGHCCSRAPCVRRPRSSVPFNVAAVPTCWTRIPT